MRIAIIGLGLIGGSIAKAARKRFGESIYIVGTDADRAQREAARRDGTLDLVTDETAGVIEGSSIVIIATPISGVETVLNDIANTVTAGTVVTDVASVKKPIIDIAENILPQHSVFVGGHPMTGSEFSGYDAGDEYLFENAVWVLCSDESPEVFEKENERLVSFISALGARILVLPASEHDSLAARTSHLPQLLAVNLMKVASNNSSDSFGDLAAGGFRDMTRIASSSYGIWNDILAANYSNILDALAEFATALRQTRNRIIEEDFDSVKKLFDDAAASRDTIPATGKGFLYPLADLYVGLIDEPGSLRKLTSALFDENINIKDLELLKLREGTGGTFRVSFDSQKEADEARRILTDMGYTVKHM